jgi:phosphatidylserine/phosphatidylglycerophosphate/cardiolipin synthase-like enzyme
MLWHGWLNGLSVGFHMMASASRLPRVLTACVLSVTVLGMMFLASVVSPTVQAEPPSNHPKVCFSPEGHCASVILDQIGLAQRSIRVQAYSFTSRDIAEALIAAAQRGVDVAVIVDKSQTSERYSVLPLLNEAHLSVFIDYCCAIAHNKVLIIDENRLITGSYNFTKAAEAKNAENLLLLDDPILAKSYLANWDMHRAGAEKLAMR